MSQMSDAACRSALLTGKVPSYLFQVRWRGSAFATLKEIQRTYDLETLSRHDAYMQSRGITKNERWFVYTSECRSVDGAVRIVKIGISARVEAREANREKNPLIVWRPAKFIDCVSKDVAAKVECSVLASAAVAGLWLSHEFVAKCKLSKQLAKRPFCKSARMLLVSC